MESKVGVQAGLHSKLKIIPVYIKTVSQNNQFTYLTRLFHWSFFFLNKYRLYFSFVSSIFLESVLLSTPQHLCSVILSLSCIDNWNGLTICHHSLTLLKYTPSEFQVATILIIVFFTLKSFNLEMVSLGSLDKYFYTTSIPFFTAIRKMFIPVFKS